MLFLSVLPLPFFLLFLALFFRPKFPAFLQSVLADLILASTVHALLNPPNDSAWVQYGNGFLAVTYAVRTVELLVIRDADDLMGLERVPPTSYSWRPMPSRIGWKRLCWVGDLLINPRGIGWSHGSAKYLPSHIKIVNGEECIETNQSKSKPEHDNRKLPPALLNHSLETPSVWKFIGYQILRLIAVYLLFDAHQTIFVRNYDAACAAFARAVNASLGISISLATSHHLVTTYILPPSCWLAVYSFMDGVHAVHCLIGVGLLGSFFPGNLVGETWMYPDWFGSVGYLLRLRLKDVWGKMWHDLCRCPLLSISITFSPRGPPVLKTFAIVYISFVLSGSFHAAGAYTVSLDLYSAGMMMAFFNVLPVFIALQEFLGGWLVPKFLGKGGVAGIVGWVFDAVVMVIWARWTCPWFMRYSSVPEIIASFGLPESVWGWAFEV